MSEHVFSMRLHCTYSGADNAIGQLQVSHLADGEWQPFELNLLSPGFSVYVYSLFTCQHTYFRINCAESGLALTAADGALELIAGNDWIINRLHVDFSGVLRSGEASADQIQHVIERMSHCPVSRNTRAIPDSQTTVHFS